MNRLKDTYKHMVAVASALLLALSVLPACSDDEGGGPGEEEGFATLVVSLQASSNSEPIGTRAAGDPTETEEEENDYEREIENWWVLIYNNDGFVDYLSNRKQSSATTPAGDDSKFSTSIKLPVGAYRLYGFANLNSVNDADKFLQQLERGAIKESDLVADRTSLAGQAINIKNVLERFNVSSDTRPSIPMSSYSESVNLLANEQNTVTLELYRMIGKVRVEITNQTGGDIDLDGLSMSFFRTTGDIFLMPYSGLDNVGTNVMSNTMAPIFPKGSTSNYEEYEYPVAENEKIAVNTTGKYSFYVPETPLEGQANNGASPMTITFNVPQKNGENTRETVFDFVRRNDLLKIEATLANIDSRLVYSNRNMPIGGIPKTILQTEDGIQINIPIQVVASHTGPIEIQYELEGISNYTDDNIQIRYKAEKENTSYSYSEAFLRNNIKDGNDYGLLIDPENGTSLENDIEITLTPDQIISGSDDPNATEIMGNNEGTITVYTQDLAEDADATIELTLVARCTADGVSTEVEIPYTIVIQNYDKTTTEGGN